MNPDTEKPISLADLPWPKPVTRLYRRTREVALIDERGRGDYRVDLDRCRTPGALLGWIEHLSQKNWVTPKHIQELIQHAETENLIVVDRGA